MPTTRHSRAIQRRTHPDPSRQICKTDIGHRRRNHNKCLQWLPVPLVKSPRILVDCQWISNNNSSLHSRITVSSRLQHINSSIIPMRTTAGHQCILRPACNNSNIRLETCHLRLLPVIILDRSTSNNIRTSVLLTRTQTHPIIAMIPKEANQQAILTDQVPITTMSNPRHVPR